VVAVCTTEPHEIEWAKSNAEYTEFGIAVYDDYDDMLASQADLHAAWVSTSTDVHAVQSLKAIEKGLHVLCEKPISTDLAKVSPSFTILLLQLLIGPRQITDGDACCD
jgi:myo-inositol 2-dehydrogenase/D-chiro-inositol 1-dehydrogenase